MENRIKSYLSAEFMARKVPVSAGDFERLMEGPLTFQAILHQELQKARKEGYQEALGEVALQITKKIEGYIVQILRIGNIVAEVVEKSLATDVKITQYRAKFSFDTNWINVIFVINASREGEEKFSGILNEVERLVTEEGNFTAEAFVINEKDAQIDYASIKNDYPFIFPSQSKAPR